MGSLKLSAEHRALLHAAAISDGVIDALGDYTAERGEDLPDYLAKNSKMRLPALMLAAPGLDGRTYWQARPDNPAVGRDGKPVKYVFGSKEKGGYTPIAVVREGRPGGPVLLQEGTKQARAAATWAPDEWAVWAVFGCQALVNGLTDLSPLSGRKVVVSFDGDRHTNTDVKTGHATTVRLAYEAGAADVSTIDLPPELMVGPTDGLDDVLARSQNPAGTVLELLTFAEPEEPPVGALPKAVDPDDENVLSRLFGEDDDDHAPNDWGTDAGQARFIWSSINLGLKYCDGIGWLLWDGKRWAPRSETQVAGSVEDFYKARFDHALAGWSADHSKRNLKKRAEFFASRLSIAKINATVAALRLVSTVDGDEPWDVFDADPYLLNTQSGVADLRTGELLPHDQDLLLTKITAGAYRPGFTHPDWTKALEALPDDDTRAWAKIRFGAATVGEQIADDAVLLHGEGENGKTAIGNDGVFVAVGSYGHRSPSELVGGSKADDRSASPELVALRGVRFALIEELPQDFYLNTKRIKDVAGTSTIRARQLYEKPITFRASHDLFINTNYAPNVTETDWGTWRRLTMVPFPFTFASNPSGPLELPGDPGLKRRLAKGEDGQHDAIVTWLVEGAMAALEDASPLRIGKRDDDDGRCPTVREATRQWRMANDLMLGYADENLEFDLDSVVSKTDFVAHFGRWLRCNGMAPWSAKLIVQRMSTHPTYSGVTERRQREDDDLVRPPSDGEAWPELPSRPLVLSGVRFTAANRSRMVGGRGY